MAYVYVVSASNITDTSSERSWKNWLIWIANLKTAGWTARGSSCTGSSGTAYSSTPDGVDRWVGKTSAEAAAVDNQPVWLVLEHATSLAQICFTFAGGTVAQTFIIARNKFETGGAWRTSTGVNARPTDTASTAKERELSSVDAPNNVWGNTAGVRVHAMSRSDGEASWLVQDFAGAPDNGVPFAGFAKLKTANVADTNPYITLFTSTSDVTAFVAANLGSCPMRVLLQTGSSEWIWIAAIKGYSTYLSTSVGNNPFTGKGVLYPCPMFSIQTIPQYYRGTIPDLAQAPDGYVTRDGINNLTYMTFGGFAFPWDGSSSMGGTARFANFMAMDLEKQTASGGSPAPFNTGIEVP